MLFMEKEPPVIKKTAIATQIVSPVTERTLPVTKDTVILLGIGVEENNVH